MNRNTKPGAVIFTGDKQRLTKFYQAMTGLPIRVNDDGVTVLASEHFELVIHALPGEPPGHPSDAREDVYVKPFFPVASLAEARERAASLGGNLRPAAEEWEARGFRACEAVDPDGNVIQFRQVSNRKHR
jgi:catechol 2,3-dioxygenase-like lactoylglutathione lyase family enzyme